MTSANRMRQSLIRETTFGTLPGSPRMRTERITGETLEYTPVFVNSEELRSDRMNADPIKVNETTGGGINFEWSYPVPRTAMSERLASLFWNDWVETPERDNDGTADSVITGVATTGTVITVTTGATFRVGHLVRNTGFGVANNNGVFRCTTASATVPAFVGSGITDETVPAAAARMKVVGFAGVSGDITAAAAGLASTTLDFTTLGLLPGMWLKIGGTAAGDKFATAALNDWVRISGTVTATAIPLDNLPTGWTTDAGSGKTIKVWFGDQIKNGTTRISHSTERSFLGQTTPTHVLHKGLLADTMELTIPSEQKITGSFGMVGMTSGEGTVANGNSYDAATTNAIMAGSVNVGRIAESGATVVSPNWAKQLTLRFNNHLRRLTAADAVGAVDIQPGDFPVTGTLQTYFGSRTLYTKLIAGTVGAISARVAKNSQATILQVPRATFTKGSPNAQQKNSDVMLPLDFEASVDSLTTAHALLDRLEYYE